MRLLILWSLLHLIFHTLSGFIHFLEIGVVESNVLILTMMSQNLQKKPAMALMMMKMGWLMRMNLLLMRFFMLVTGIVMAIARLGIHAEKLKIMLLEQEKL